LAEKLVESVGGRNGIKGPVCRFVDGIDANKTRHPLQLIILVALRVAKYDVARSSATNDSKLQI
jgi:hypothetical protein